MTREYPLTPLPGVLAVLVRDNRLLLVRRGREPDRGKWGFPGGLTELGETTAGAALRELAEETGVSATAEGVLDLVDAITRDETGRVRWHYVLAAVLCRWQAGEPRAADDAEAAAWFTLDEIAGLPCSLHLPRLAALALGRG